MYGPNAGFENAEDGLMDRWVQYFRCESESEGQLSCFHRRPHLICPPTFFNPTVLFILSRECTLLVIMTMHDDDIASYFRNPLNLKLASACRHTFRCFDPTHADLGAACPRLVCLFAIRKEDIYPITQMYKSIFQVFTR